MDLISGYYKLGRNLQVHPGGFVDKKLDEVLATGRTSEEFPTLLGPRDAGCVPREESVDGDGSSSNISSFEPIANSTLGCREKYGAPGHRNSTLDCAASRWTDQADGFGREDDAPSGAPRFNGNSTCDNFSERTA